MSEGGFECSVKDIDESSDGNIYGSSDEEVIEKENNELDITSLNTMMNTRSNRRTRNQKRIILCSNLIDHDKGDSMSELSNSERSDDGNEDNSEYNPSDEYGSGNEKSKVSGVYILMIFIY